MTAKNTGSLDSEAHFTECERARFWDWTAAASEGVKQRQKLTAWDTKTEVDTEAVPMETLASASLAIRFAAQVSRERQRALPWAVLDDGLTSRGGPTPVC